MLSVLSFNILAPHYAQASFYPPGIDRFLSLESRRANTSSFLLRMKDVCDIMGFQEVVHDPTYCDEFAYLQDLLGDEFFGMFVPHDCHYWIEYGPYKVNGNALFFRRAVFSEPTWFDISLETGNHAILGEATHLPTRRQIRVLVIHLDSEDQNRREYELAVALDTLQINSKTIDFIIGDFNMEPSARAYDTIRQAGYHDSLHELGINTPTFSFLTSQPIDHIAYRDPTGAIIPIPGKTKVLDCGLWQEYPGLGIIDLLAAPRLKACLDLYGSDHIPILATFCVSPAMLC
jgi:endonuclease/exonuclease/phosphatase family metal-dependent hydrolase